MEAIVQSYENPWSAREADFPWAEDAVTQLKFLLNYAVLAPSSHNAQPWLFRVAGGELELYVDRTRALPVADPDDREMMIGCGAALFHLKTAMRHFGFVPVVHLFPDLDDRDLVAFIRLGEKTSASILEHRLFMAIAHRHTNRMPFDPQPVPPETLDLLRAAAEEEKATLLILEDPDQRNDLADLIAEGDRRQGADPHFRRELAAWVHPNRSHSRDGIPGYAHGMNDILSITGPLLIRTFDWGRGQAAKDRQLLDGSPILAVLNTVGDGPSNWLTAGQALDRVLLTASDYGISASFLNQALELPDLRNQVKERLGVQGYPQLVLRLGYGPQVRATPRRPVHDVISMQRFF